MPMPANQALAIVQYLEREIKADSCPACGHASQPAKKWWSLQRDLFGLPTVDTSAGGSVLNADTLAMVAMTNCDVCQYAMLFPIAHMNFS